VSVCSPSRLERISAKFGIWESLFAWVNVTTTVPNKSHDSVGEKSHTHLINLAQIAAKITLSNHLQQLTPVILYFTLYCTEGGLVTIRIITKYYY
jgi:hypothetical protein